MFFFFSSTPDGVEILFSSGGESRLANIKLTCFAGFCVAKIGAKLA
jgi:hypothetical protein